MNLIISLQKSETKGIARMLECQNILDSLFPLVTRYNLNRSLLIAFCCKTLCRIREICTFHNCVLECQCQLPWNSSATEIDNSLIPGKGDWRAQDSLLVRSTVLS